MDKKLLVVLFVFLAFLFSAWFVVAIGQMNSFSGKSVLNKVENASPGEYVILHFISEQQLQSTVNDLLGQGWTCIGGVSVDASAGYYQTMMAPGGQK